MRALSHSVRLTVFTATAVFSLLGTVLPVAAAEHPSSDPMEIVRLGSRMYFSAATAAHGRELWTSDGTPAGTYELKDINPGSGDASPNRLTVAGNRLFFLAYEGFSLKLWVTDGTEAGTIPLSEGYANGLTDVDGTLFFTRSTTVWTSDGTVDGTDPVAAVPDAVGVLDDFRQGEAAFQGAYYFFVQTVLSEWWLWRSDGTADGTEAVDSLAPVDDQKVPAEAVVSGNLLYFIIFADGWGGGIPPADLWKSDGTEAGTMQVKDIDPSPDPTDADGVGDLTDVGGTLYFTASGSLWKTNGTEAGTVFLKVIDPTGSSMPIVLTRLKSKLMFSGYDGSAFYLWRSKGSAASTKRIHPAGPYSCRFFDPGCTPLDYTPANVGPLMFFPASEGPKGIELWVTDGKNTGTHLLKDIKRGTGSSRPSDMASGMSKLFFVANDGRHGRELWISDGTGAGTRMVRDINPG